MVHKRITERFPLLIPIRTWQRNLFYYSKMLFDQQTYATQKKEALLPFEVVKEKVKMVNTASGYAIKYQENKVHNLKIISKTMNHICIYPGETFSFCFLSRKDKKFGKYKEGLVLLNGQTIPKKGGGVCQLSNLLYYAFLQTPLTIIERHGHKIKTIPNSDKETLEGVDATITSGWLDLKVRNDTRDTYQILITFDSVFMTVSIFCNQEQSFKIKIINENLEYFWEEGKKFESVDVIKEIIDKKGRTIEKKLLYKEKVEIKYNLPDEKGEKLK